MAQNHATAPYGLMPPVSGHSVRLDAGENIIDMAKTNQPSTFTFKEVQAWFTEFQDDSDRAAAVLAVAFLDSQLEQILRAFSAEENEILEL